MFKKLYGNMTIKIFKELGEWTTNRKIPVRNFNIKRDVSESP